MIGTDLRNITSNSAMGYTAYIEYTLIISIHLPKYRKYHTVFFTVLVIKSQPHNCISIYRPFQP